MNRHFLPVRPGDMTLPNGETSVSQALTEFGAELSPCAAAVCLETMPRAGTRRMRCLLLVVLLSGRLGFYRLEGAARPGPSTVRHIANELATGVESSLTAEAMTRLSYETDFSVESITSLPDEISNWEIESWRLCRLAELANSGRYTETRLLLSAIDEERQELTQLLNGAIDRALAGTDHEVLQLARLHGGDWTKPLNYLTPPDLIHGRNRKQAVLRFPLLLSIVVSGSAGQVGRRLWQPVLDAVDQGASLQAAVTAAFDCRPFAFRHLTGKSLSEVGMAWQGAVDALLQTLSALPPERLPRNPEEWEALAGLRVLVFRISGGSLAAARFRPLLEEAAKKRWQLGDLSHRSAVNRALLLDSLVREIENVLITQLRLRFNLPEQDTYEAREVAEGLLIGLGFSRAENLVTRWRAECAMPPLVDLGESLRGFPRLIDAPFHAGSRVIRQLLTERDLSEESARLEHCVNSFGGKCAQGYCYILSVRNTANESLSTVEVVIELDKLGTPQLLPIQHKAYRNTVPDPEDRGAVAIFLAEMAKPEQRGRLASLAERRQRLLLGRVFERDCVRADRFLEFLGRAEPKRMQLPMAIETLAQRALDRKKLRESQRNALLDEFSRRAMVENAQC